MSRVFATLILLFSFAAGAERVSAFSTEDEKLKAVFEFVFNNEAAKFGWAADVQSMWCPTNIDNLLTRLSQANVDLRDAKVWYIKPPVNRVLRPLKARDGANEWMFHVVLILNGRVLDLDYTAKPTIVSLDDYMKKMWSRRAKMFVREIPAREYLSGYRGNWNWYLEGGDGRYPLISLYGAPPQRSKAR